MADAVHGQPVSESPAESKGDEPELSTSRSEAVAAIARKAEAWGHARGWSGSDPYDGGNATRFVTMLHGHPRGRQLVAQLVKRSAFNLRPALGVAPGLSAVTLANVVVTHAVGGFLTPDMHRERMLGAAEELERLRLPKYPEPSWGYHWDAQSRLLYYPRTEPNGIATSLAGLALLDTFDSTQDEHWLSLALGAGEYFLHRVPRTRTPDGEFFGYLAGDRTPIHNANMLACALLARLSAHTGRSDLRSAAQSGVSFTVAHQRSDGSWLYGETPRSRWVDGFHTGYVLDCIRICRDAGIENLEPALKRGLEYYWHGLFLEDGTAKYYANSVYPIDAQNAAQGIQTFALAAQDDDVHLARAWKIFDFASQRLSRGDGAFIFQRRRLWTNRQPHMRWVVSPMLLGMTQLHRALTARKG